MRTLTVVTWFCTEFFDFLFALSSPASLSSRAAAFLYAPVHACTCVYVLRGRGSAEGGDVSGGRGRVRRQGGRNFLGVGEVYIINLSGV